MKFSFLKNFENENYSFEGHIYLEHRFFGCRSYKHYRGFLAAKYEVTYSSKANGEKDLSFP